MPPPNERQIISVLKQLACVAPTEDEASRAIARLRQVLALDPASPLRRLVASTSLAAGVVLVITIVVFALTANTTSAEEALERVLVETEGFKGWIHVTQQARSGERFMAHYQAATGTLAWVSEWQDWRRATFISLDRGTQVVYDNQDGRIRLTSITREYYERQLASVSQRVTPAQYIRETRERFGGSGLNVARALEGNEERFEMTNTSPEASTSCARKLTLWAQTDTARITRVRCGEGDAAGETRYAYDERVIRDIYDLGVPKDAAVVDDRSGEDLATHKAARIELVGPATLTRSQLADGVRTARSQIKNLTVTYRFFSKRHQPKMVNHWLDTVVTQDDKIYLDRRYSFDPPEGGGHQFHRMLSWDGRRSTQFEVPRAVAMVQSGIVSHELDTQGMAFFDFNLLNLSQRGQHGGQNLAAILDSPRAKIREHMERFADFTCHVVDIPGRTIWIDAGRGFTPVRQRYYASRNSDNILMEFIAVAVDEVQPGLWFVTSGRKLTPARPEVIELSSEVGMFMWVAGPIGRPAITVNARLPERMFDLSQNLPPGTEFWDKDTGEQKIISLPTGN